MFSLLNDPMFETTKNSFSYVLCMLFQEIRPLNFLFGLEWILEYFSCGACSPYNIRRASRKSDVKQMFEITGTIQIKGSVTASVLFSLMREVLPHMKCWIIVFYSSKVL